MIEEQSCGNNVSEYNRTEFWDSMAEAFDGFPEQTAENNPVIRILEKKSILTQKSRVLDIGCAAGKYAFYFSRRCEEVAAVDISPKMLERAETNRKKLGYGNISFVQADWSELPLDKIGGAGSFDLVFANMSPGVCSEKELKKMMDASREWCYYGIGAGRTRLVNDRVYAELNLPQLTQKNKQRIPRIFDQIWCAGYRPYVDYISSNTSLDMTLEKAVPYYINAANAVIQSQQKRSITKEQSEKIVSLLETIAINGVVHEEISGNTAVLIWNIMK